MPTEQTFRCDSCGREETVSGASAQAPVCCSLPMKPYEPLFTMENPEKPSEVGGEFICGVCGERVSLPEIPPEKPICCGQAMERP